jgi:hypothetical protein
MQYFPALERIAVRRHWRLVQLAKSGCPPEAVRVIYQPLDREYPECDAWRNAALARIARERPALVVTSSSVAYRVVEGGRVLDGDAGLAALAGADPQTLSRLARIVPRVAVLTDAPRPPIDVPDCVATHLRELRRCAFPRRAAMARARVLAASAGRVRGVQLIDTASRFCLRRLCPAVIGDVLVYRQTGHITATYMRTLAPWLEEELS